MIQMPLEVSCFSFWSSYSRFDLLIFPHLLLHAGEQYSDRIDPDQKHIAAANSSWTVPLLADLSEDPDDMFETAYLRSFSL